MMFGLGVLLLWPTWTAVGVAQVPVVPLEVAQRAQDEGSVAIIVQVGALAQPEGYLQPRRYRSSERLSGQWKSRS